MKGSLDTEARISMLSAYDITLAIYNIALIPIIFFSLLYLILSFLNIGISKPKHGRYSVPQSLPFVTVQIPSYNDPVAERCVRKCMEFDYPKGKYEIIIADDSTNLKTQCLLRGIAEDKSGLVKYVHRENRQGFKAGALLNAMKHSKGEIITIFDADFIPGKDYLKKIVKPFSDPKVAIVQTRQGFYNDSTNLITRFAAYTLMTYHTIILPLNNRINCVFFGGTAGAIRRSAFEDVGGWSTDTLVEDTELSIRLLMKDYRSVYLEFETPSEVPNTLESFVRQQMRWCFGNTRIFFDYAWKIVTSRVLDWRQKLMMIYLSLGNIATPFVILMTFFGLAGWFLGDPKIYQLSDLIVLASKFAVTGGFVVMGMVTLKKHNRLNEFWTFLFSSMTVGVIIAAGNSIGFLLAAANRKFHWYCTPKTGNALAIGK